MAENTFNIEDMEIVLDDGPPPPDDAFADVSADDIFEILVIQETETSTIETKIEIPDDASESEETAIVFNLEGNTIQSYNLCQQNDDYDVKRNFSRITTEPDDDGPDGAAAETRTPKRMGKIPMALRGLIGQAKMFMLKGNYNMAIKICVNILKECPNASEPFFTLSDIYEQTGNMKKSLEMAVIGNSLCCVASEDWVSLGETCEANNMLPLADFCLTKAIHKDRRNVDLHIKRASVLERLGTAKSAMYEYDRLLRKLRPDQKDSIITLSKLLVENFVKDNNYDRASNILMHVFSVFPNDIKPRDFVTCLNYLVKTKNYKKCLELLVEYYNLDFVADVNTDTSIKEIIECDVPSAMPMLIRVKVIEILVQLKSFSVLPSIYEPVLNLPEVSQLHLDVADVLLVSDQHKCAILFFKKLIDSKNETFDQHMIKIKYSNCLKTLGHLEQAVDGYNKILEVDPQQLKVKYDLYLTLKKLNRIEESLQILDMDKKENHDCRLLYEYASAIINKDDMFQECLRVTNLLFSRHSLPVSTLREVKCMLTLQNAENRHDTLLAFKKELYYFQKEKLLTVNPLPCLKEEWDLLCKICSKCCEKNFHYEGLKMMLSAINSTLFVPHNYQIILNTLKFAFKTRAFKIGFMLCRYLLAKHPLAPQLANLFCFFINRCKAKKQAKFIFRLAAKYPDNVALNLLDTNVFNDTYNYQLIFSRYTELLNKLENKNALYFMLGVSTLRLCTFRSGTQRHSLVTLAIGFLMKYKEHKGVEHEQECYFNIGRAYHQVGMPSKALHYYKLVLETEPFSEEYCLKTAAAYNLHLIYMDSGNIDVALMYISHIQV